MKRIFLLIIMVGFILPIFSDDQIGGVNYFKVIATKHAVGGTTTVELSGTNYRFHDFGGGNTLTLYFDNNMNCFVLERVDGFFVSVKEKIDYDIVALIKNGHDLLEDEENGMLEGTLEPNEIDYVGVLPDPWRAVLYD